VSHFTYTHRNQVDSRLLVVGSQIASLTLGPSFDHNLWCKCPNGSCEAILDMYTSRPFQRYNKCYNARCFDPCNHTLSFRESRRTPKSHFRECEWWLHTSLKVGLRHPIPRFGLGTILGVMPHLITVEACSFGFHPNVSLGLAPFERSPLLHKVPLGLPHALGIVWAYPWLGFILPHILEALHFRDGFG